MTWKTIANRSFLLVALLVLLGGLLPPGLYWLNLGSVPTLTPAEAIQLLNQKDKRIAPLIDVRSPEEYAAYHIDGSTNIPLDKIASMAPPLQGDPNLSSPPMLLICDSGWASAQAARILRSSGFAKNGDRVYSIRG